VQNCFEISEKQPLAMSKYFFYDRQLPTHNCRSAMILRFSQPDSHDELQMTHPNHSNKFANPM
jgi:hypothetical protein